MTISNQQSAHKRYLLTATLVLALLSIVLVVGSYRLDPFSLYEENMDNQASIDLFWHIRLHKPYRMHTAKAKHQIFGSSRSGRLAPEILTADGTSSYNASLPGGTLYEIQRMLEHAHSIEPLSNVVIGLDYFMFRDDRPKFLPGFEDARLLKPDAGWSDSIRYRWQRVLDSWSALFSRSAIVANLKLFEQEREANRRDFFANGTWVAEPGELAGHWVYSMLVREKYHEFTQLSKQHDLSRLATILQFCNEQNIDVTLLLSPTHAYLMNAIKLADGWPRYLQYQQEVVDQVAVAEENGLSVRLLGFENNKTMLYEAVSPDYQWYLDGIHYTPAAGDKMMRCIMQRPDCEAAFKPVELGPTNIETYLEGVTSLMQNYPAERPKDYKRLTTQISKLKAEERPDAAPLLTH